MNAKGRHFRAVDVLLLSLIFGIILTVITIPASEGIEISGAHIFCTIKMPFQDLPITESQINSWLVEQTDRTIQIDPSPKKASDFLSSKI